MRPSYAVVIEEAEGTFCAHVPDLPGCVATGDTRDEVLVQIRAAIAFHLEGMAADAASPPAPRTSVATVTI
jgi:predicted RNase H-like HicB family nuclease